MFVYFFLVLIMMPIMASVQKSKNEGARISLALFIGFSLLVLVPGMRDRHIGTDTSIYIGHFESDRVANTKISEYSLTDEVGYKILEKLALNLSNDYWVLLTLIAIVGVLFNLRVIMKLSVNYAMSIFLFITLGTYLFMFNGARQAIAASIFGISIIYLIKGNLKKYILWVLIAALFHKTIMITLPLYYLFRLRYSIRSLTIIIVSSFVLFGFMYSIISLLPDIYSDKYMQYEDRGATGAGLLTIFNVITTIFFIYVRGYISNQDRYQYDIFLFINIFSSLIYALVYINGQDVNLVRLTLYFSMGTILIWPLIFKNIIVFKSVLLKSLFYLFHLIFYFIYLGKMSRLTPYKFNPDLFPYFQ